MPDYSLDARSIASATAPSGRFAAAALQRYIATLPTVRAGGTVHLMQGPRPLRLGAVAKSPAPQPGAPETHLAGTSAGQDTLASGLGTRSMTLRHGASPFSGPHAAQPGIGQGRDAVLAGRSSDADAGGGASRGVPDPLDRVAPHGADTLPSGTSKGAEASPLVGAGRGALDATPLDAAHGDDTIFGGGGGGLTVQVQRAVAAIASGAPDPQHAVAIELANADTFTLHALTIDFAGGATGAF